MIRSLLFVSLLLITLTGFSQASGDFRSHQTGDWNLTSTWERFNGTAWITPAPSTPTGIANVVTVLSPHVITVTANVSVAKVIIQAGANVTINPSVVLTASNAAGVPDFTIAGSLTNTGTFAIANGGLGNNCQVSVDGTFNNSGVVTFGGTTTRLNFNLNSVYDHQFTTTAGAIPKGLTATIVTWNISSTCRISGYTSNTTAPTGLNQTFGNFIWDTQNLSAGGSEFDLNGQLTNIAGVFTINSTGADGDYLVLSDATSYTLTVGNDFLINDGVTALIATAPATATVNVGGGIFINGGSNYASANDGNATINATGSFFILGGDYDFGLGSATVLVNASADVAFNSASVTSSGASATINFIGGTQNFLASSPSISGLINYHIGSSSTTTLQANLFGDGDFVLDGNLVLTNGDAAGALQTGTGGGSVRVAGARTYNSGSTITYGPGTVAIGNGHPATAGVNTVINNSAGVSLLANTAFGGNLTLADGSLTVGSRTITLNGNFNPGSNFLAVTPASNLVINGTGAFGNLALSGGPTIGNLSLNRTSGSVTLASDLTIGGVYTQSSGDINLNGHILTISGNYARTGGNLVPTSTSDIIINGSGTVPSDIGIASGALHALTISRSATITTSQAFTVTNLNLITGTLNNTGTISIADGGGIVRDLGSFTNNTIITAGSFDVTYKNSTTTPQATGAELPTGTTQLRNLTVNSTGNINLSSAITVNGALTFTSGVFDAGGNALDLKGGLVSNNTSVLTGSAITFSGSTTVSGSTEVTFGTVNVTGTLNPTSNFRINGDLNNDGVLNSSSGMVTFGGSTTITGANPSTFHDVTIATASTLIAPSTPDATTITVTGAWVNNGTFTSGIASNTVAFAGTSTISGTAVTPNSDFSSIVISGVLTGPASLGLRGSFTNNGTFNAGTGSVLFRGSVVQSIAGTTNTSFNNIATSNANQVIVSTNQSITGALRLLSGAGTFNANGKLTLISTPARDARIAQIASGTITGKVIAQRYLPDATGAKVYRYIASPLTNATVSDWKADFPITGTFTDPSTAAEWTPGGPTFVQANPSLFFYNEAHTPTTTLEDRYESYPLNGTSSTASTIVNGKGYAAFVRFGARTIDLTGNPRQGSVGVGVTAQSAGGNDGWNLIGNPYPAPISWENVTLPAGVGSQIALKDNTNNSEIGAGQYVYYTKGGLAIPDDFTGTIAMGQAFWVRATSAATITFQETNKVAVSSPEFIRTGTPTDILRVSVTGNGKSDQMLMQFRTDGNNAGDYQYDAFKLKNDFINLYSFSSDNQKLAINVMGQMDCFSQVRLGIDNITTGTYQLQFQQIETFEAGIQMQLVDKYTGKTTTIDPNNLSYQFAVSSDTASFGANRFRLTFSSSPVGQTLSIVKNDICSGIDASIGLSGTQRGISYTLKLGANQVDQSIDGTSGGINFSIPSSLLAAGVNRFSITAQSLTCAAASYTQKDSVTIEKVYAVSAVHPGVSCLAGSVTLGAEGAPSNGFYNWYTYKDDVQPIFGQNQSSYTTPAIGKNNTYYVAIVNALGCEGARVPVQAQVLIYDNAKITLKDGGMLVSNFPSGNHWSLDGRPLSDTTATLHVNASGTYALEVNVGSCTTNDQIVFLVTGLAEPASIKGYPNPLTGAQSVYTLEVQDTGNKMGDAVVVFDALGKKVGVMPLAFDGMIKKGSYDFSLHSSGVYFIRVFSGDSGKVLKIIKN